jgi:GH15 family glucan-1,4-alpha-glucosidase
VFSRLLDWNHGGFCSVSPENGPFEVSRRYLDGTLVLETTFTAPDAELRLLDCFSMRPGGREAPHRQILRRVQCVKGRADVYLRLAPRFDYGDVRPWIRRHEGGVFSAIGTSEGLILWSDADLDFSGDHDLVARFALEEGDGLRLSIQYAAPEELDNGRPRPGDPGDFEERFEHTIEWWRRWSGRGRSAGDFTAEATRSAIVLKALTFAPTGAIVAAPTAGLPEDVGGTRNWDYRFSWIRDSYFTVRSLGELGHDHEAEGFRRFVERTTAGKAEDLQIVYGVGGERRLTEIELDHLEGYRGARPVRIGNDAHRQEQLDVYGHLLGLSWHWQDKGHAPDDHYWRFLTELVDTVARRWRDKDCGIWETRGELRHFVHSKVMCWAAVDMGLKLARECSLEAPTDRWTAVRDDIRAAVEDQGYDHEAGTFVQAFGTKHLDAALLRLPSVGFVDYTDERMVRTVDAIREELSDGGLIARYRSHDGIEGPEGVFLTCSFWLVECLARQGREREALEIFDRARSAGNDLGLFSEEYDVSTGEPLGNFPQGLTHLSHLEAVLALAEPSRSGG